MSFAFLCFVAVLRFADSVHLSIFFFRKKCSPQITVHAFVATQCVVWIPQRQFNDNLQTNRQVVSVMINVTCFNTWQFTTVETGTEIDINQT